VNIVITGGSGGIGRAFIAALARRVEVGSIIATCHRTPPENDQAKVTWQRLDLTEEHAVRDWAQSLGEIDWLINAAGILHTPAQGPEKTVRQLDPAFFMENIRINTLPTLLLAKYLHTRFRHGRPAIFATISARVGSIGDNRLGGWFSYRSSKAALNMGLKTLAIEWRRQLPNVAVVALHPGTTDTALSRPFQRNVPRDQLFTPGQTASYLLNVLDALTAAQSGRFLAFDGEQLPW
jgi:NAD(P)-dependent dehydrogenase (short-subunit alcohol dehydrogenase family)